MLVSLNWIWASFVVKEKIDNPKKHLEDLGLVRQFPKEALKTFTSDRGKEFTCYPLVENLGIPFFFANAYSSWQRGSNENANGLLREYFPKKTDLAAISEEALNKALYDINHRPRKCLAYRTACEALEDEFE